MVRVLHLAGRETDYQTREALEALSRESPGAADEVSASVLRLGEGASGVVRGYMRMRRGADRPDLIHAWGEHALTTAAMASNVPIVYSPTVFPDRRSIGWVRAISAYRYVNVVCPTDTMRRAFVERGVPVERCHLVRPGVAFSKIVKRKDHELRERLGIGPGDYVLLAAGESTRAAAHRDAAWAAVLLHVLDRKCRLLVWGEGPLADSIHRLTQRLGQPGMLVDATRTLRERIPYERVVTAADCALVTARGPVPTLPINVSMAVGLPHVATVTPTVAELLEDRHTALFSTKPNAHLLARRVLDLREDTSLQWQLSDMAGTEAFEFFSGTRFARQWRTAYRQIAAGEIVDVPTEAPGAGLRFHGRG
jgi:glycosyltransferase involved in cell wall biosynthesis